MIKTQNLTPEIYYQRSRDFQLFGRLFDVAVNSVKASADMIYTLDNMSFTGTKLVGLLATTLGFKQKHEYSIAQLKAVCSILPTILKKKGTLEAITMVCTAILKAEGLTDKFEFFKDENDPLHYILLLPQLQNITLLIDLLSYIWPAGATITITESGSILKQEPTTVSTISSQINYLDTGEVNPSTHEAKRPEFYMQIQADPVAHNGITPTESEEQEIELGLGNFTSGALFRNENGSETPSALINKKTNSSVE